jgi:two-component system response regulator AtoC
MQLTSTQGERSVSLLIVDDEETVRDYLQTFFTSAGYAAAGVASGSEALDRLRTGPGPDVVLLDIMMPEMDGLQVLRRIREMDGTIPVLILSAVGRTKTVVEAMKLGASDYLTKPFEDDELELALQKVLEKRRLVQEVENLRELLAGEGRMSEIISISPSMQAVKNLVLQIADTDATAMIQGESGVGKELVARAIHRNSRRAAQAYVRVNCAALPAELLESELFGYERGAFTGAIREKPGKFELAHDGTIFLDEVAEMSPALQAKFLHVLQDGEFSKLGGRRDIKVNVRVVAATNQVLERAVEEGRFREDLYYRLNVVRVHVPALRERVEDVPVLVDHFLRRFAEQYRKPNVPPIPERLMKLFMTYQWPGNVRELENMIRRWVILRDEKNLCKEIVGRMNWKESSDAAAPVEPQARFGASEDQLPCAAVQDQGMRSGLAQVVPASRFER